MLHSSIRLFSFITTGNGCFNSEKFAWGYDHRNAKLSKNLNTICDVLSKNCDFENYVTNRRNILSDAPLIFRKYLEFRKK